MKEEIANCVPFDIESSEKARLIQNPNPIGRELFHCLTEDFDYLTFKISGTITRENDFSVVPSTVAYARSVNPP